MATIRADTLAGIVRVCVKNPDPDDHLTLGNEYCTYPLSGIESGLTNVVCDDGKSRYCPEAHFAPLGVDVAIVARKKQAVDAVTLNVSSQHHYTRFAIQPIEFIRNNNLPFWAGNVIKYVCRHDAKDGVKDLYKARDYLNKEIRRLEGTDEWWK